MLVKCSTHIIMYVCTYAHTSCCLQDRGISEKVFQVPEKLHFTLGVLRIFSKEEEVCISMCVHTYMVCML